MDPATIIGTTSAILSFVQFTGKIISTAIEIRDNAGQVTKSNQKLDATVSEFNSRLAKLRSQRPALSKSSSGVSAVEDDAQASLLLSLSKCEDLGNKIQNLLKDISTKKKGPLKPSAKKPKSQEHPNETPENSPAALPAKASLSQVFKATFKSLWLEKDVKSLREEWETCVKHFNADFMRYVEDLFTRALKVHGNSTSGAGICALSEYVINEICTSTCPYRLDFQIRFQALQKVSDDNSTTLNALQGNLQTLIMDYKDTNLGQLRSFLDEFNSQNSKAAKEERNEEYILKSLEFPGMDSRRDKIHDAAEGTLTWLLSYRDISFNHDDDSYISWRYRSESRYHDDSQISLKQWLATEHGIHHHTRGRPGYDREPWDYENSKISLGEWLATGNGIYHITGKPGGGKSVTMKSIAESPESCEQLHGWASQEQKQLITAKFYVWKAADDSWLQNKVEGMIRTLLYQILADRRDLISRVFPEHWHPERFHFNSAITGTKLQPREIQEASERVFGSSDIVGPYRIFLLIDGLDEFNDDRETHYQIAKRIKDWCGRNPGNVKACISSREDSPFMNTFEPHQRLRLHLFTYRDIWKLTWQRLMEHSHFTSSRFTDEQRRNLIGTIADEAEGVFLWVILTIVELTHSLDANQDFETLRQVIRRFNKDLNKFFKEILSRIPDMYREEARALFQIVRFTTRGTSHDQFLCLFHVYKAVTHATAAQYLVRRTCDAVTHEDAVEELCWSALRIRIGFNWCSFVCVCYVGGKKG